jgi:hypothetical protein
VSVEENRREEKRVEEEKEKMASPAATSNFSLKVSEQIEEYQLYALEQTYPKEFLEREFRLLKAALSAWDKPLPKNKTHWYRLIASHMKREWLKEPPQEPPPQKVVWAEEIENAK